MTTVPTEVPQGVVPQSTIVPQDDSLFIPYFTRTYENLAQAINAKDNGAFQIAVTNTATNIPSIANFGAFIVCVSGTTSVLNPLTNVINYLPTITASLCKSDVGVAGQVVQLGFKVGTGDIWAGATLTISSTASNFQINHSVAGQTGNFNIRIIGTQ